VIWAIGLVCAVAAAYQILAIFACLRHAMREPSRKPMSEGVSVLKPVRGFHAGFDQAILSHLKQTYPNFELLLGYRDPADSAIPEIIRQRATHWLCPQTAPNGKVGVLMDLVKQVRYPIIIVNDADIVVPPDYLRACTGPKEIRGPADSKRSEWPPISLPAPWSHRGWVFPSSVSARR